ncbi:hypothetical protein KKG56_03995, partial [bacterium]|nr:hypothetical protein [bacterium]
RHDYRLSTAFLIKIRYCTQVKKKLRGDVLTGIETHSYVGVSVDKEVKGLGERCIVAPATSILICTA